MPRPELSDQEIQDYLELKRLWARHSESEEYCMSQARFIPLPASDSTLPEAIALVEEQLLNSTDLGKSAFVTETFPSQKMSDNLFLAHYAMQVYRASVFFIWHIGKGGLERIPTHSEELCFRKQFYTLYGVVTMSDQRFAQLGPAFALADLVRLDNLFTWFYTICHSNHKRLAQIFKTPRARDVRANLRSAQDAKAGKIELPSGDMRTERNYAFAGIWSVFDEIQPQIEYDFPEGRNKRPPLPDVVY